MADFLTRFAIAGASVLFSAWLALIGGRWLVRQMAAIRPYLAAFLVFTFVAMNYAQKSGTNEPPRGVSNGRVECFDGRVSTYAEATADKEHVERVEGSNDELTTTELTETAVAGTEGGWGGITDRLPQPPVRVAEGASVPSVVELFRLASVATNETWGFSAPSDATVHELWQRRGACDIVELWNYGIAEMRKWEAT